MFFKHLTFDLHFLRLYLSFLYSFLFVISSPFGKGKSPDFFFFSKLVQYTMRCFIRKMLTECPPCVCRDICHEQDREGLCLWEIHLSPVPHMCLSFLRVVCKAAPGRPPAPLTMTHGDSRTVFNYLMVTKRDFLKDWVCKLLHLLNRGTNQSCVTLPHPLAILSSVLTCRLQAFDVPWRFQEVSPKKEENDGKGNHGYRNPRNHSYGHSYHTDDKQECLQRQKQIGSLSGVLSKTVLTALFC